MKIVVLAAASGVIGAGAVFVWGKPMAPLSIGAIVVMLASMAYSDIFGFKRHRRSKHPKRLSRPQTLTLMGLVVLNTVMTLMRVFG